MYDIWRIFASHRLLILQECQPMLRTAGDRWQNQIMDASNCNTKIKAACPQHTADTQKWCTASRKESVDTKNINKGDWGKLGIRLQAEKWPLLLAAASWGTPRLSRHFKCTQGQREKREVPGKNAIALLSQLATVKFLWVRTSVIRSPHDIHNTGLRG